MRRGEDRDRTSLRPVPRKENQGRRIRTDSIVLGTRIPTLILVKVVTMGTQELLAELSGLRSDLDQVRFPLDLPQVETARASAESIRHQLDDYVISRLETIDAPLLAVVGGSTGAGKSTLVNSLVGRPVSTPGVIRPTTISPVLVHHPDDAQWFTDRRILPGLVRTEQSTGDSTSVHLVAEPSLPRGLALLDAPDIDSVVAANRHLAAQLLQAADLWLFVTSAARYADAVPWDFLHEAAGRHAAVAVVCDRVPPAAMREVPAHLGQLMTSRGLAESPLFAIPETVTDSEGMLPDQAIAPIRSFLAGLAADQEFSRAPCCNALPGERIVGITYRGKGLVIHAIDCPMLAEYEDQPERWVDLNWREGRHPPVYSTQLSLTIRHDAGVLGRICTLIGQQGANITDLEFVDRKSDFYRLRVEVALRDREHLHALTTAIEAESDVAQVARIRDRDRLV